jgi:tRNA(Ile)-lysidine synthase
MADPRKPPTLLRAWLDGRQGRGDTRYLVAFSGGIDSTVLLHGMAELCAARQLTLIALHVDHALHTESELWARQCRDMAQAIGVPFLAHRLAPAQLGRKGPEAAARKARYGWFASLVGPGDVLVTAHHRGDQAETVLYNLCRGTGGRGIAAMPAERPFFSATLARPLLAAGRKSIEAYATENRLKWIEDPSNRSTAFDRNFIRHLVIPCLETRWPAVESCIARAALNAADDQRILDRVADGQLHEATLADAFNPFSGVPVLDVVNLRRLPIEDFLNLIRRWILLAGFVVPSRDRLLRLRVDLVLSDSPSGCFAWDHAWVRRYRNTLYLTAEVCDRVREPVAWSPETNLPIPGSRLMLVARKVTGEGISCAFLKDRVLRVDWTTASRTLRVTRGGPRKSLRKIFQESGIPPWMRRILPRIHAGDELLGVPGVVENADCAAGVGESGLLFTLGVCDFPESGLERLADPTDSGVSRQGTGALRNKLDR